MSPLRFPELSTAAQVRAVLALHLETAHPPKRGYWLLESMACPTCAGLQAALARVRQEETV